MQTFSRLMKPYPDLECWSRQLQLPAQNNIHLYDTGEAAKTPVMLLHGLGDEADTWRHILPILKDQYRAVAPDLPGFGLSEKADGKYSIPLNVDTILELLNQLAVPKTILAGHSMGATIAHAFALKHPERVERLVLISGSLVSKENRLSLELLFFLIPGLGEWMYNRLRKNPMAAYQTLTPYYNNLESLPQADRDFLFRRVNERVWSDKQRQAFLGSLRSLAAWLPAQQKGLPERLRGWIIPTSILWGENDRVASIHNAHALVDLIPSARLVIVPHAGHNLQQEKAEVVVDAIAGRI